MAETIEENPKFIEQFLKDTPSKGKFVTETLYSWTCADCGATQKSPLRR
ncbi:hypothetical protein [Photobacterium chitinilyticum]|nr:hypothetical protein [Photobacterium chitinilyticum]